MVRKNTRHDEASRQRTEQEDGQQTATREVELLADTGIFYTVIPSNPDSIDRTNEPKVDNRYKRAIDS